MKVVATTRQAQGTGARRREPCQGGANGGSHPYLATTRQAQGTGASRRLRHLGKVPGVLYGGKSEPVNIELDHNPLFHSLKREKFYASVLEMELDGRSEQVLLRDFQMHPYRPLVMHIDFQ